MPRGKRNPGTPGRKPVGKVYLVPEKEAPPAPEYLTGHARDAWENLAPCFRELGIAPADYLQVEVYCLAYDEVRELGETIAAEGRTLVTETGFSRERPEWKMRMKAIGEMRQLGGQLGLGPSTRGRGGGDGGDNGEEIYNPGDKQMTIGVPSMR